MKSLSTKLTLAFLLIGILGVALVTGLTAVSTRVEFDRFLTTERRGRSERDDREGRGGREERREQIEAEVAQESEGNNGRFDTSDDNRRSSELQFLFNVLRASVLSGAGAVIAALFGGVLLSRGLTRPLRALTDATQRMADGELGTQVKVSSRDEIGRLANAFNHMSQDLAQATHKRQQMTADIAHDLRTPLTILRGYMEGIKDGSVANSPEIVDIMYDEVIHLEHLVKDLRTLSLADAGELPLHKQKIHPRVLLERTGLAYVVQAEQKGLALRIETADPLPQIEVDVERMTQVLNNLVSNALRFTEQGEIVLSATAVKNHVTLQVRDTGQGIDAAILPHIFDRFYRADESRQRDADGTVSSGLGLAIARAVVRAHGATIQATSVATDTDPATSGTQFTITLPSNFFHQRFKSKK
ncbi:MAG: ATP-binding protein [Chloroflexota bacterium]